ncbi:cytosol aminopeptidase-like [Dendronephthya gigantea]|uniref:cytosol aminopeptidase-like n=1 Tax=Dendronephthya gigantea TaxID=151771 RepID=UPI00106C0045|nr:cytosol aminopeptidase-like [Dendronephthya gigantea]
MAVRPVQAGRTLGWFISSCPQHLGRFLGSSAADEAAGTRVGLIVGVYENENDNSEVDLTQVGKAVDERTKGKLSQNLAIGQKKFKVGKSRLFYNIDEEFPVIAAVNIGKRKLKQNDLECVNERKENLRHAAAVGVWSLRDLGVTHIEVDPSNDAKAMAEAASLSKFVFDSLKQEDKRQGPLSISVHDASGSSSVKQGWKKGCILGEGQNFARELMETPANLLTPKLFTEKVTERISRLPSVEVIVREKEWIEEMKMGAFLSVAKGSCELPFLLEMKYFGASSRDSAPLVLVGKGITFDSGGISIKPAAGMSLMKGDMGGAATVTGVLETIARLELPLNVIAVMPLCENMPSGSANKPGDVVTAMNGKTIEIENTDAEGRLILADALTYSHSFNPGTLISVATLTGAIGVALGAGAAGVYSNSRELWLHLEKAAFVSGDRVWRMPSFQLYSKQVQSDRADLVNLGKKPHAGGSCTAAAFLKEFVPSDNWAHFDIAGVMANSDEVPYLGKGMSGRPTRTLVEFASRICRQ